MFNIYHYFISANAGTVKWTFNDSNTSYVELYSPTVEQNEDVMIRLQQKGEENWWYINLYSLSPESMLVIMNNISKFAVGNLTIINTTLNSECVSKLSEVLSCNVKIVELSFESSLFTGGIKQVSDALVNNITLQELRFMDIPLADEDITNLSNMISINMTLKGLCLMNCNITDNGVRYICEGLTKNQSLTELNIRSNRQITSVSTSTIAELINTTKSLTELSLHGTSLNNDDIKTICTTLIENTTIKTLLLSEQQKEYCEMLDFYQVIKDRLCFY